MTIKVPVRTTGSLRGFYDVWEGPEKEKYVRVIDLTKSGTIYEKKTVNVIPDKKIIGAFEDEISFVEINIRKKYTGSTPDYTENMVITREKLQNMKDLVFTYPRLGEASAEAFEQYEYRLLWSFSGDRGSYRVPADENKWITSSRYVIPLSPSITPRKLEFIFDNRLISDSTYHALDVTLMGIFNGRKKNIKNSFHTIQITSYLPEEVSPSITIKTRRNNWYTMPSGNL